MPRPAEVTAQHFKATLFNRIEQAMADAPSGASAPIALHVGDTWFDLPPELDQPLGEEPWGERLSRYGDTRGEPELRRVLARKLAGRNRLPVSSAEEVQLSYGATGGLFIALRRLLEPGEELLALAPHWPIFKVVGATAGVRVVPVPFFDRLAQAAEQDDLAAWIEPFLNEKTRAIYFNNPNNPTGVLMDHRRLEQLARFAREHDLWLISDEAYEDFGWTGEVVSIASLPEAFERTVSVFSFSKSFAAAGLRLGYVAGSSGAIARMNPAHVGTGYEAPRPAQLRALRGLQQGERVIGRLREAYTEGRRAALENITVPHLPAEGSFYLFLDLRDRWAGLSDEEKLDRMLRAGVMLSPGEAFGGPQWEGWARFCYTSEPPERVAEAARRVAQL